MALQIRKHTYRSREGFLVCGRHKNGGIFPTRIFTLTRVSAEHIRAKVNAGEQTTVADFTFGSEG